jgi:curved DNA-binding protein CbpA
MAPAAFDPYTVLGVGRNATSSEIRAAYRDLVARYHPDKHSGNPLEGLAAEKMAEINRAHEILSDPKRRAAYDQGAGGPRGMPSPGWSQAAAGKNSRLVKVVALVLALPLLVRFGSGLARLLAALVRALFRSLEGMRGTPVGLALLVAAVGLFVLLLLRRRRSKARRG